MLLTGQTSILVVDNDAQLCPLVCALLREEGYPHVAMARDGLEALLRLQLSPEPLVVLCDYRLPRVDGLRLLTALARGSPALQRHVGILMTGDEHLLARTASRSRQCPSIVCLHKPFHLKELLAAVTTASTRLQRKMATGVQCPRVGRERRAQRKEPRGSCKTQQLAVRSHEPGVDAASLATSG